MKSPAVVIQRTAKTAMLEKFSRGVAALTPFLQATFLFAFTFSYHAQLQQNTIAPLRQLICTVRHGEGVQLQLASFKAAKEQELRHVKIASALCAAAVVGILSWPSTQETYWVATGLWYTSLMLSFFSLVSSAHQRLSDAIPSLDGAVSKDVLDRALRVVLWSDTAKFLVSQYLPTPSQKSCDRVRFTWRNAVMVYLWQSMLMQMSWSCFTFLLGLAVHVLQVYLPAQPEAVDEKIAIMFIVGGSFAALNFIGCAVLTKWVIEEAASASGLLTV